VKTIEDLKEKNIQVQTRIDKIPPPADSVDNFAKALVSNTIEVRNLIKNKLEY